jgi:hypothetical protein
VVETLTRIWDDAHVRESRRLDKTLLGDRGQQYQRTAGDKVLVAFDQVI